MADRLITPCPYRVEAWVGEELLAGTTSALRLDATDGAPSLWFPSDDVRDGRAGTPGTGELEGRVAFDHELVRIDVIDGMPEDDERDVTLKRFPTWGDAADLLDVLAVRPDGQGRFSSLARADWRRPVVEGSQMLAQAIVAGAHHAPGRRAVSASMVFARVADARVPLTFEVDEIAGGRTFTALGVRALQGERACAAGTLLFDVTATDVMRHSVDPPEVPDPYDLAPHDMSITGRDIRLVQDPSAIGSDAPEGPPVLDAWVRFRTAPDDPCLHAALLAQFSGYLSIGASLRPHPGIGQDQAHGSLSTAVNAITLSFHREVRADRWMLYHHRSTFAGDGMTHSECRVHDEGGDLLASFTVDAMVRGAARREGPVDPRTSL